MKEVLILVALIVMYVLAIIFVPFAIIWALNTLFALAIPFTFYTWLAVVVLNLTWLYKPRVNINKSKNVVIK